MSHEGTVRVFPVLASGLRQQREYDRLNCPRGVPWSLLAPHEEQAVRNHGQTLQRLADRGGLGPDEMVAILSDRGWHTMTEEDAVGQLVALIAKEAT